MKFESVAISNFRSIESLEFGIPPPGLYHISGQNLQDEKLGANGAGKTTILDAIHWCLTGESISGLKGPGVEGWDLPKEVDVTVHLQGRKIRRTRHPHKLYINDNEASDEELQEFESMLFAFGQFGDSFLDLSPADKMGMFSLFLDLGGWITRSNAAKRLAAESEHKWDLVKARIQTARIKIEAAEDQLGSLRARLESVGDLEALQERVDNGSRKLEAFLAKKTDLSDELESARSLINKRTAQNMELSGHKQRIRSELREAKRTLAGYEEEIAKHNKLIEAGICPVCKEKLTGAEGTHFHARLAELDEAVRLYGSYVTGSTEEAEENEAKIEKSEAVTRKAQERLADVTKRLKALDSEEADLREEVAVAERKLAAEGSVAETLKQSIAEQRAVKEEAVREGKAAKAENTKIEEEWENRSFWVDGFRRIRLLAAERAATTFQNLANAQLKELGMENWRIEFNMERETAAGGLSKKFHCEVFGPKSKEGASWKAWSGGESQRLRVAADMALATLSMPKTNMELWDEPTAHLNPDGVEQLMQAFAKRASRENKAIFIIDHRSAEFPFKNTLHVTKSQAGISTAEWRGG